MTMAACRRAPEPRRDEAAANPRMSRAAGSAGQQRGHSGLCRDAMPYKVQDRHSPGRSPAIGHRHARRRGGQHIVDADDQRPRALDPASAGPAIPIQSCSGGDPPRSRRTLSIRRERPARSERCAGIARLTFLYTRVRWHDFVRDDRQCNELRRFISSPRVCRLRSSRHLDPDSTSRPSGAA